VGDLFSHSKWVLPFAMFGVVFQAFKLIDEHASAEVREELATFLKTHAYESYLGNLPEIIQNTFNRIFGQRHFSVRCIMVSALLSLASLIVTFTISIFWDFPALVATGAFIQKGLDALHTSNSDQIKHLATSLSKIPNIVLYSVGVVSWIFWCLLPDYIALLKIRIMLLIFRYSNPRIPSLIITLFVDFIVGFWVFIASFSFLQTFLIGISIYLYDPSVFKQFSSMSIATFLLWGFLFGIEAGILTFKNLLITFVPVANLFWASMIPSIWLWAYVISSLVTRMLLASRPLMRKTVYLLDVSGHPIRSIGVVAAFVMAIGSGMIVLAASFL
jgi:hypothetical protein